MKLIFGKITAPVRDSEDNILKNIKEVRLRRGIVQVNLASALGLHKLSSKNQKFQ